MQKSSASSTIVLRLGEPGAVQYDLCQGPVRRRRYSNIHASPSRVHLSWERAANSSSSVMAKCKIGMRVISPFSCKIGLSNHSRIWPEQIELFVFQSLFGQSRSAPSTC